MPRYSDNTIEQVRAASDIVDVIGSYLPLKRAGANFVTLCPFHKEKSPSFNVHPAKQIFHCFGCHKGGDVFRFVQDYENIGFLEAVQRLAERARIPLEVDDTPGAREQRSRKEQLLQLHEAICQRWQQCLSGEAAGQVARDYLEKRGVEPAAVKEFRLGAAPDAWDDTVNWARAKGFDADLCELAGLVVRKEDTGRVYDRFRGRLMFPICDEQGRVIAFSGRVLAGDEKVAKYVNSPETPIFTKGRVLFALDRAKRAILDAGVAIVCEGQLDTIACHAAGIRNVVAPQGTALTAEHARILKRYVDELILCFDGDRAGRAAAVRALDDSLASGLALRVASIPPPDDPDSYLRRHGAEALRAVLGRAEGFFDFYLQHLCGEHDPSTDRGRQVIVRAMAEKVQRTGNAVLVDTHAQKVAQRLGVDVSAVRAEFRKARATAALSDADEPLPEPDGEGDEPPARPSPIESWLLRYLIHADGELLAWAHAHLDLSWVVHPAVRRVAELRLGQAGEPDVHNLGVLLDGLGEDDFARMLATEAASGQRAIPDLEANLREATRRLRDAWIDRQMAFLGTRLVEPGLSEDDRFDAMRRQHELRLWKRRPLEPLGEA